MRLPRPRDGTEFVRLDSYIPREVDKLLRLAAQREGKTRQKIIEDRLRAAKPAAPKSP